MPLLAHETQTVFSNGTAVVLLLPLGNSTGGSGATGDAGAWSMFLLHENNSTVNNRAGIMADRKLIPGFFFANCMTIVFAVNGKFF
jgi:hypothetical protein